MLYEMTEMRENVRELEEEEGEVVYVTRYFGTGGPLSQASKGRTTNAIPN